MKEIVFKRLRFNDASAARINELIAEKVFRMTKTRVPHIVLDYSTDIAAAWKVFEALEANYEYANLEHYPSDGGDDWYTVSHWECCVENLTGPPAPTAPLAICFLALIKHGMSHEEIYALFDPWEA